MPRREKTDEELHPENYFSHPSGHIRDRIVIHESMDIPKEGLFISLNGYPFLCKPNEEIDIPRPVRLMMDTRVRTETVQGDDGRDHSRNIRRINYTLIKEGVNLPGAEAIQAEADKLTAASAS